MNLRETIDLYLGGPGSGCNPDGGKCGRPSIGVKRDLSESFDYQKKDYQRAVRLWTGKRYSNIRKSLSRIKTGEKVRFSEDLRAARVLLEKLEKAPVFKRDLYRGIGVPRPIDEVESLFTVG